MIPGNISDEQPPHYILFLILLSVALDVFVLELSSKQQRATTRENLSSGFPRKQVSNQSLQLNRLDMKIDFFSHEASLGIILLKKQTTKLLMILRGCAGWSGPLLLQITEDRFSQLRSNCYMCHLTSTHIRKQDAKFDYREI